MSRKITAHLKVLHVLSNLGVGGAETWLLALLRHFKEHEEELGVRVETDVFLTHGFRDQLDDEAENLGARLIYARYGRKTLPSFIHHWRKALANGHYQAVHDHQEFSAGWHFLFGYGLLPPVRVAHLHNPMGHQESYNSSGLRGATIGVGNHLVGRYATHLLSTSYQLIEEQGFHKIKSAKTLEKKALYCGFDTRRFLTDKGECRASLLREFGWHGAVQIMLFVGRLDSHIDPTKNQKNPAFCLEIARCCALLNSDFRCLIAGGGEKIIDSYRAKVASWGLSDQIVFLGVRFDVPRLMGGSDLLLFPSKSEGLGMVAVEAQAAGLPVLASDGVPEECSVVNGMVEFLSLNCGVEHWARTVLKKMALPPHDSQMANRIVEDSPFSIRESARQLIGIYQSRSREGKSL